MYYQNDSKLSRFILLSLGIHVLLLISMYIIKPNHVQEQNAITVNINIGGLVQQKVQSENNETSAKESVPATKSEVAPEVVKPQTQPQAIQKEVVKPQPQVIQKEVVKPQPQVVQKEVVKPQVIQKEVVKPQPQVIQKEVVKPQPQVIQKEVVKPQPQAVQKEVVKPQPQVIQKEVVKPQPQAVKKQAEPTEAELLANELDQLLQSKSSQGNDSVSDALSDASWSGAPRKTISFPNIASKIPSQYQTRGYGYSVTAKITFSPQGWVSSVELTRSSGDPRIDSIFRNELRKIRIEESSGTSYDTITKSFSISIK